MRRIPGFPEGWEVDSGSDISELMEDPSVQWVTHSFDLDPAMIQVQRILEHLPEEESRSRPIAYHWTDNSYRWYFDIDFTPEQLEAIETYTIDALRPCHELGFFPSAEFLRRKISENRHIHADVASITVIGLLPGSQGTGLPSHADYDTLAAVTDFLGESKIPTLAFGMELCRQLGIPVHQPRSPSVTYIKDQHFGLGHIPTSHFSPKDVRPNEYFFQGYGGGPTQ